MDIRKKQRKIKALSILEKLKNFEKIEILKNYHETISIKNDLLDNDRKLINLLSNTENDMRASIEDNFLHGFESLSVKQDFLNDLYLSKLKNSTHLSEIGEKSNELLSLLSHVNSQQKLVSEKHENETTIYRRAIIEKSERS